VAEALAAVERGEADVAVGPISITAARAEHVTFTQPYFRTGLSILAPPARSLLDRVRPFMTRAFLASVSLLLGILLAVGTAVWLAERRKNPDHFPPSLLSGIGNGVWMALVTMTTVGYGDRVPQTVAGRALVGIWMLVSMIFASSLTAFMATAFTLSQIEGPAISSSEDLDKRPVAVVRGTTSVAFVDSEGGRPVAATTLDGAIETLLRGKADAVVFDRPMLRDYINRHPEERLRLSEASYEPQAYGLAVPIGDPLRRPLDISLLRLQESGDLQQIIKSWLGSP
jgi:polar amino acid transport system substrate-binding protein